MKLCSTKHEIRALITVLDAEEDVSSFLLGKLKKAHFGHEPTKEIFQRLRNLIKSGKALPSRNLLKDDPALSDSARNVLASKLNSIDNGNDAMSLMQVLNDYRRIRSVHDGAKEALEILKSQDVDSATLDAIIKKLDKHVKNALTTDHDNIQTIGEGSTSRPIIDRILDPTKKKFIPTGIPSFDSQNGGWSRGSLVTLAANSGGGKCLRSSHIVPTSKGLLRLGDLWQQANGDGQQRHLDVDVLSHVGFARTNAVLQTRGVTWRVTTNLGDVIEGLPDHKLLTWDVHTGSEQWKRLDAIEDGDWLVKSIGTQLFGDASALPYTNNTMPHSCLQTDTILPTALTCDVAEFFGWVVSEGDRYGRITQQDVEMQSRIMKLTSTVFGCCRKFNRDVLAAGKVANDFLLAFCGDVKSGKRFVPLVVMSAPEVVQCSFLRSLFEGDGTVGVVRGGRGGSTPRYRVAYTSISRRLTYDVKAILENIGLWCQVRKRFVLCNGKRFRVYEISICQNSFGLFQEKIGFLSTRKKHLLSAAVDYVNAYDDKHLATAHPHNKLPCSTLALDYLCHLKKLCETVYFTITYVNRHGTETSYKKRGSLERLFPKPRSSASSLLEACATDYGFTRHSLQKLLVLHENAESHDLRDLLEKDPTAKQYRDKLAAVLRRDWVCVRQSKNTEKQHAVYDISVPQAESYSVSGIMGHNSVMGLQVAINQYRAGCKVVYVSMEMSTEEVYERIVSNISGVDFSQVLLKKLSIKQEKLIRRKWKEFEEYGQGNGTFFNVWVPNESVSLSNIVNTIAPLKPDVIFIDMINLLDPEDKTNQNQAQNLGESARYAKIAANAIGSVIVLLAQLNEDDKVKYARAIVENSNNVWSWHMGDKEKETHFFTIKQTKARNQKTFDVFMVEDFAHMSVSGRDADDTEDSDMASANDA